MKHRLLESDDEHVVAVPGTTSPSTTTTAPELRPHEVEPGQSTGAPVRPSGSAQTVYTDRWPFCVLVISIGAFMSILDISIVNVAIPTMRNDFGVSDVDIEWVATAYSLALGVVVPVSGWLGARF